MLHHNIRKYFLGPHETQEWFRSCSPLNPQLSVSCQLPAHAFGIALWQVLKTAGETHLPGPLGSCFTQTSRAPEGIAPIRYNHVWVFSVLVKYKIRN